ncbi:MAG: hypothetical protein QXY22_04870 [Candidatus Nitrosotenuis sp.]|uniref:Uncharacterized protein n=1 Tax=Candidatus Nitrosotenuis uzonensis TaxID=1407055 RepID=A0A812EYJ9_9ARCH|nr:hypothetical protein [Candidatus Nitrosotenuis uzonensis]CAE6504933.1 conserved hypothetical protein [Candidatus Nitrosotenuis uzonensis]
MEFHPSQIPIVKTFTVKDEKAASESAAQMTEIGFENQKGGFKVLMPKQEKLAKRIGFTITSELNFRLRKLKQERNLRYWTYHHDDENYAIVLISANVFSELGL